MRTLQLHLASDRDLHSALQPLQPFDPDLLLCFGAQPFFRGDTLHRALRAAAPNAALAGCSGAGEIAAAQVHDGTLALTALKFEHGARACGTSTTLVGMADSFGAGVRLGAALAPEGLRHVLVWGTGVNINGSGLVEGLQATLPRGTSISGGLAGDGGAFIETFTLGDTGSASDQLVAVGLYGESLGVASRPRPKWNCQIRFTITRAKSG